MRKVNSRASTLQTVAVFAVAMAWAEAAVVFYLRTIANRIMPYQPEPLPVIEEARTAELEREIVTIVMLDTVAVSAGRTRQARLGHALVAFCTWDIFYYVFMQPMTGWPCTLPEWDILFPPSLLWWGPVIAPMLISVFRILWGTIVTQFEHIRLWHTQNLRVIVLALVEAARPLYMFMGELLRVAGQAVDTIRDVLQGRFNWPVFKVALGLMRVPVIELTLQVHQAMQCINCGSRTQRNFECTRPPQS